jgi:hypothetical protein
MGNLRGDCATPAALHRRVAPFAIWAPVAGDVAAGCGDPTGA